MKVIIRDECGRVTTFSGSLEDINKSIKKNFNITYSLYQDNKIKYFNVADEIYTVEWFAPTEDEIKISKETISEYQRGYIEGAKTILEKVENEIEKLLNNKKNQDDVL